MASRTKRTVFLSLLTTLLVIGTADAQEQERERPKNQERPRGETRHGPRSRGYVPRPRQHQPGHGSIRYGQRHGYRPYYVRPGVQRKDLRHGRIAHHPPRGSVIRHLPAGHRTVVIRGRQYHCHDGVFYLPIARGSGVQYVVSRAPVGVAVTALPSAYQVVSYEGRPYYYYDDVHYVEEVIEGRPQYVVVEPPIGATIVQLPREHTVVVVKGRRYYRIEGRYYEPFLLGRSVVYRRVSIDIDD
ncbi:MAG: DUF6515 family protein [Planctomycetota bacterium]